MKKLIICVLIISLVLTSCTEDSDRKILSSTPENFEELLSMINYNHKSIIKPEIDFKEYISDYKAEQVKWEGGFFNGTKHNGNDTITKKEIEDDIENLFTNLKNGYGLYNYFGGDEAFNLAKDNLMKKYENVDNITVSLFISQLANELKFIKDYHFHIYNASTNRPVLSYIFDEYEFEKVNGKYINKDNNKVAAKINKSEDLESVFKLFISSDGRLVYHPVILSNDVVVSINIEYEDNYKHDLIYSRNKFTYNIDEEIKLDIKSDIPIIRAARMGFDQAKTGHNARKFLEYADQYKDENILIVDLRNNSGGNGILPLKWMNNYSSEFVATNYSSVKYITIDKIKDYVNEDKDNYQPLNELSEVYGLDEISKEYSKALAHDDKFVSNENLLIILANKNTGSAGEMFVDLAHNVENTIIVGTNTAGVLIGDSTGYITLPNSKVPVTFGTGLSFFPENYFEEFVGFMPDLWVSGDAEEAVLNFIEKHINKK